MVLLDDFASVQNIINASSEFATVLKKHGITDPEKWSPPRSPLATSMAKMVCSRMRAC